MPSLPPATHCPPRQPAPGSGAAPSLYRPRNARGSPLYKIVQDTLESLAAEQAASPGLRVSRFAEDSLRAFLECGVHRFGVVRFRCKECGHDAIVPFSCRRRGACPSCDRKRAVQTGARAVSELLPHVPYRQWVLVVPKRLRFFVDRDPQLAGEISRILSRVLVRFYREAALRSGIEGASLPDQAAPAVLSVVQRFGSRVNRHVHIHGVVSDGVFALVGGKRLAFVPAPDPTPEELASLAEDLRRRILRRFVKLGVLPEETAREMRRWPHSGFSLDAKVRVEASDRAGLERLLGYCLRPAIALNRLEYLPERGLVRYRPPKHNGITPPLLEWSPVEFLRRFAKIIPPPRVNLVRYAGALGPRSGLRSRVCEAARRKIAYEDLLAGRTDRLTAALRRVQRIAGKAKTAAQRAWAACIQRVFEVNPLLCPKCGVEMIPVAAIVDDRELERLLRHLEIPTDFPITKPARAPPLPLWSEDSQVDPVVDAWEGVDEPKRVPATA